MAPSGLSRNPAAPEVWSSPERHGKGSQNYTVPGTDAYQAGQNLQDKPKQSDSQLKEVLQEFGVGSGVS